MVEGEKMSKSLGNFFTLRDLVAKGVDPIAFRFAIQSNHYRKLYNFSFEGLRAARATLERLRTFRMRMEDEPGAAAGRARLGRISTRGLRVARAREEFWRAMADDLNTPEALAAILTLVTDINARDDDRPLTRGRAATRSSRCSTKPTGSSPRGRARRARPPDAEIEALISARRQAKAARNWAEADRLRDAAQGDGDPARGQKDGTVRWKRAE